MLEHQIKKQLLDFEFATKQKALKWQQEVAFQEQKRYEKVIAAILEKYEDGSLQKIDKITIDIGVVTEDEVSEKIGIELDNALEDILAKIPSKGGVISTNNHQNSSPIDESPKRKELLDFLAYFIHQGHFPWFASIASIAALEEQLLTQFSLPDIVFAMRSKKLLDSRWGRYRFFYQFSKEFVRKVISGYFEEALLQLSTIDKFCEEQFYHPALADHFSSKKGSQESNLPLAFQWICLNAPQEQATQWLAAYTKWLLKGRWTSRIPLASVAEWKTITPLAIDAGEAQIQLRINQLFRLIALRITSNKAVSTFESKKQKDTNKEHQSYVKDSQQTEPNNLLAEKRFKKSFEDDKKMKKEAHIQSGKQAEKNPKEQSHLPRAKQLKNEANQVENDIKNAQNTLENSREVKKQFQTATKTKVVGNRTGSSAKDVHKTADARNINTTSKATSDAKDSSLKKEDAIASSLDPTPSDALVFHMEGTKGMQSEELDPLPFTNETHADVASIDYYVQDSGLLLVWPYLHRLFENLNYTKEKKFVSRAHQERAVLLLGYIALGKTECEEQQLVFSKFLCAWPLKIPVQKHLDITDHEKEEVTSMLLGLIAHWSILKNTSIEGLRETFFWRNGKLEEKEEHWKLTVEQKSTDILLSHLPFGISMIKLPWHGKMLRVDWT